MKTAQKDLSRKRSRLTFPESHVTLKKQNAQEHSEEESMSAGTLQRDFRLSGAVTATGSLMRGNGGTQTEDGFGVAGMNPPAQTGAKG